MKGSRNLALLKELLLQVCGLSFEQEREQTLTTALCRRMSSVGIDAPAAYHALLIRDQDELLRLVELLTVNETYFFREPDCLKLMTDTLLPEYLKERRDRPVRILSAGCSTGEEPYSLAMMLADRYGAECGHLFSITGVDIDTSAIAAARQGIYGRGSFRGVERDLPGRHFEPCGKGEMQVKENIRRLVGFEVVNLRGAFYPHGMHLPDFIFYRNVSIYFPQTVQHEIFGRLAGLLTEGGYLFVGAAETIQHDIGLLSLIERDAIFFFRKALPQVFEERRRQGRQAVQPSGVLKQAAGARAISAGVMGAVSQKERNAGTPPVERTSDRSSSGTVQHDSGDRFAAALAMAHDNRTAAALTALDALIERDGSFVKAHTLKGSLLLNAARFEEARIACEAALDGDELCREAYLMLGIIERHEGNDEEAMRRFREAVYLDSCCWPAHFYTAEILFARGDGKRAKKGYEATLRILQEGGPEKQGQACFPLSFKTEQFVVISKHKLSLLKGNG